MSELVSTLTAIASDLGDDENRVLIAIASRLRMGAATYGRLSIETDPRQFVSEALEEALDLANYLAMALVKRGAA